MARVLVVESDIAIAARVADELRRRGHVLDVVANGAEALASLSAYWPDIIVLDLVLPVTEGWDFMERYRRLIQGHIIPLVVTSVTEDLPESVAAFGVRRLLRQPLNPQDAANAIEESCC